MQILSEQQKKILNVLSSFTKEKGYVPSQRELARKVGLKSPNTVDYHLKKMEEKGFIKCVKNRFRAIELIEQSLSSPDAVKVPILGTVPAGVPNLALEEYDEFIDLDRSLTRGKVFALRVRGDSMKDAGILEGDLVIVRVQPSANDGDIVTARFEEEATVKYFRKKKEGVFLVPANNKYNPIPAKEAQIIGKVIGVLRRY